MTKSVLGRAPEVSDDDIINAGKMLLDDGSRVTGFALRRAVGNRGDAGRLFRVWNAYLEATRCNPNTDGIELPGELAANLAAMGKKLVADLEGMAEAMNATAVQTAESRVRQAIKLADEREQNAEAEVNDAMLFIDELEKKLVANQEANNELRRTCDELKCSEADLTRRVSELQNIELQHEETTLENSNLKRTYHAVDEENKELQIHVAELKKEVAVLREQLGDVARERDQFLRELIQLTNPS